MKQEKKINIGERVFELTSFRRWGVVGDIRIAAPGHLVYCIEFDVQGEAVWVSIFIGKYK